MADNASNYLEVKLLSMLLNGTSIPGICGPCTTPITSFSVQLHTASPGETGDCATNETNYTGYQRVGIERTSSGWVVAGSTSATATASPANNIDFPLCSATTATITHFSLGNSTVALSTGVMYIYGSLSPTISVSSGIIPRLTTATVITIT